jgi:EAL domain-containing protein (putative c-di-GMP-specific phosphodiesterase class I)
LEEEYFTDTLLYIMKGMDVNPAWIDIEMSESVALHGAVLHSNIIDALKDAGLTVSVDDFGVGYASFKNLLNIRFDRINLSKELVDIMLTQKNGKVIVGGIISLAQGLSLKVNAEGVETKEQLDCLVELGCDHIQGFYFGQPVPAERFEENWLK